MTEDKPINSRDVMELLPTVRQMCSHFLNECQKKGFDVLITSTFRNHASQAALYSIGRTKPGRIVTNAPPGWSWHNWRCAFDVVPLRQGKPVWGTAGNGIDTDPTDDDLDDLELWQRIGEIGEFAGLEWAGRWPRFREYPHFQHTYGRSIHDVNNGVPLPEMLNGHRIRFDGSMKTRVRIAFFQHCVPPRHIWRLRNGTQFFNPTEVAHA